MISCSRSRYIYMSSVCMYIFIYFSEFQCKCVNKTQQTKSYRAIKVNSIAASFLYNKFVSFVLILSPSPLFHSFSFCWFFCSCSVLITRITTRIHKVKLEWEKLWLVFLLLNARWFCHQGFSEIHKRTKKRVITEKLVLEERRYVCVSFFNLFIFHFK